MWNKIPNHIGGDSPRDDKAPAMPMSRPLRTHTTGELHTVPQIPQRRPQRRRTEEPLADLVQGTSKELEEMRDMISQISTKADIKRPPTLSTETLETMNSAVLEAKEKDMDSTEEVDRSETDGEKEIITPREDDINTVTEIQNGKADSICEAESTAFDESGFNSMDDFSVDQNAVDSSNDKVSHDLTIEEDLKEPSLNLETSPDIENLPSSIPSGDDVAVSSEKIDSPSNAPEKSGKEQILDTSSSVAENEENSMGDANLIQLASEAEKEEIGAVHTQVDREGKNIQVPQSVPEENDSTDEHQALSETSEGTPIIPPRPSRHSSATPEGSVPSIPERPKKKPLPPVPKKPSSKIAAFQEMLQKRQLQDSTSLSSKQSSKNGSLLTGNRANIASNLNGLFALPGMTAGGIPPHLSNTTPSEENSAAFPGNSVENHASDVAASKKPVQSRRSKGPRGRKLPSSFANVEKIKCESKDNSIEVYATWSINFSENPSLVERQDEPESECEVIPSSKRSTESLESNDSCNVSETMKPSPGISSEESDSLGMSGSVTQEAENDVPGIDLAIDTAQPQLTSNPKNDALLNNSTDLELISSIKSGIEVTNGNTSE